MSKPFGDPFELDAGVFTLDKAEGQRHKVARSYRLNAVQVPLLRGIGFLLLIVIGLLQALLLPEPMDVSRLAALVGFNLAYCVGSWLVLRRWFDRSGKLDLASLFLHTDIPVWFVTLYVIEGPGYQLLALFLLVRVADQAGFGFRRAFYFNNVIAAAYLGYVLILSFATAAGVNWPDRLLIFGALYLTGTYIAFTAIPIEYLTKRTRKAVHRARELLLELDEKSRQLEEASQHKSQFLASMSHELRTPLNAILGFNEMILDRVYGEVPAELNEPLEDIQKSGKHLLRLINNILDLAKIEAGRMELALADYSVHDIVESVRSTLRPLAAEKGLEFVTTLPDDLPLAYGDFGRITQCLMNLAGNSLKFTKGGKVEISVELQGATLVYRVSDTGMGIPPDKIGGLFTEFKQTDATIASEFGGTGLGLSISRKFIEMHGGRIWVESELGKGSHFIFQVPLRAEKAAA